MNNVSLIGRLTRDSELREIGGGRSACELRLAVDNPGRGGERGESVQFLGTRAGAARHAEEPQLLR
jgi:single-stranded DNA-binding protein